MYPDKLNKIINLFESLPEDERRETLVAYAVCRTGQTALQICDFLVDPQFPDGLVRLLQHLSHHAFHFGYTSIDLGFFGAQAIQRELDRAGFVARERKPVYAAAAEPWAHLMRGHDWYLTSADDDDV